MSSLSPTSKHPVKNFLFTLLALVAFVGLLSGLKIKQFSDLMAAAETMLPPPPSVSTVKSESQQWELTLNAVGTIEAVQGVTVAADIPGRVEAIMFESGQKVRKGDVLIRQDVSSEEAQLRAAEANVELAKATLKRTRELVKKQSASQSELDAALARHKEALASAQTIETTITKKTVVAPFDGHLGIRKVNIGQDLASGSEIATLQAVDKLYVNFSLPQQHLSKIAPGLTVRISTDVLDEPVEGRLVAIDPKIDVATRSVRVQAQFENKARLVLPGMYATVAVVMPEREQVLTVPKTAIAHATFGDSIFVVEEHQTESGETQLKAVQHFVQLGRSLGDYVSVVEGLKEGSTVISAGVFKLHNGAVVTVKNEGQPQYHVAPAPSDA